MKQALTIALALCLALVLTACTSAAGDNMNQAINNWATPTSHAPLQPIDIIEYRDANFSDTFGVEVVSLPSTDSMTPNKFFALEGWYGQIEFTTAENFSLNVRLAKTRSNNLSSTYVEQHIYGKETITVDGIEVKIASSPNGCAAATWTRGDVQYILHSNRKQGVPPMADIEEMVRGLDAIVV